MKYYITTDTHFGHQMLIDKGYRPECYEDKIHSELCAPDYEDVIIHLGDICIGNDEKYNTELFNTVDAKLILVRGNHDNKSDSWYYEQGWDFVCDLFILKKYGKTIVFSHEPLKQFKGDINIHGHWHNNDHRVEPDYKKWYGKRHKLLALEHTNYKPVELHKFINT
jgi:calcineurin-like phosphoesterase family protein